ASASTDGIYAAMDWVAGWAGRDRGEAGCPVPGAGAEPVPDDAVRPVQLMAGGAAFTEIVTVVRDKFGLGKMVMGGDRGIITSARIQAPNQLEDGTQRQDAYGSITALRPRHQETHGRRRSAPA